MTQPAFTVTSDFDGTLFDPNLKAFIAWYYNAQTTSLLNSHNIPFILNTGRPIWDTFSDVQIAAAGMKKPDVVVYGAGTKIVWRRGNTYELDEEWEKIMQKTGWNKAKILKAIQPILKEYNAALFDTHNEYMTRIWINKIPVEELNKFVKAVLSVVSDTKVLRTEQILLPNTEVIFSGYLLLIPSTAGKDVGMKHVLNTLRPKANLVFGDALVDLPMLMDASSEGYAVNPTAMARMELKNTKVTILEGSPPENILRIITSKLNIEKSIRNSPYRSVSSSFFSILEPFIYPKLTSDQLSLKGLELVQYSITKKHLGGMFLLVQGLLLDVFDGLRARKSPKLTSDNGQLIDGYSDRMKEYVQLANRKHYDSAISCFLPSIARARAEAIGSVVPEFDSAGGSALSRNVKLVKSYFLSSVGNVDGSNRVDKSIYLSNMQTFHNRKSLAKSFSWSNLKKYDRPSVQRLLFYISLLQSKANEQKVENSELNEALKEYMKINIEKLKNDLKITFPKINH